VGLPLLAVQEIYRFRHEELPNLALYLEEMKFKYHQDLIRKQPYVWLDYIKHNWPPLPYLKFRKLIAYDRASDYFRFTIDRAPSIGFLRVFNKCLKHRHFEIANYLNEYMYLRWPLNYDANLKVMKYTDPICQKMRLPWLPQRIFLERLDVSATILGGALIIIRNPLYLLPYVLLEKIFIQELKTSCKYYCHYKHQTVMHSSCVVHSWVDSFHCQKQQLFNWLDIAFRKSCVAYRRFIQHGWRWITK